MTLDWLIEVGHSRLKWARLDISRSPAQAIEPRSMSIDAFLQALPALEPPGCAWFAAVPASEVFQPVLSAMRKAGIDIHRIDPERVSLPVTPAYAELGVDRWLAMQPVWERLRTAFVLVDCGTATTIDYVNPQGNHQGGWILPGREASRFGLLTAAPGLKRDAPHGLDSKAVLNPALSTLESIEHGLVLQQAGVIAQIFRSMQTTLDTPLQMVITGGDAEAVRSILSCFEPDFAAMPCSELALSSISPGQATSTIWHRPELALQGLAMAASQS